MHIRYLFLNLVSVALIISGCVLFAAGAGGEAAYIASQDKKTAGQVIDDQLIVSSVKTQLLASSKVSGMNINVDSNKKVVTLRGFGRTQIEIEEAIKIAEGVDGVSKVVSELTVQQ